MNFWLNGKTLSEYVSSWDFGKTLVFLLLIYYHSEMTNCVVIIMLCTNNCCLSQAFVMHNTAARLVHFEIFGKFSVVRQRPTYVKEIVSIGLKNPIQLLLSSIWNDIF